MNIFSFINSLWKFGVFIFMLIVSTILFGIPTTLLYKLWVFIYTDCWIRKRKNNPNRQRAVLYYFPLTAPVSLYGSCFGFPFTAPCLRRMICAQDLGSDSVRIVIHSMLLLLCCNYVAMDPLSQTVFRTRMMRYYCTISLPIYQHAGWRDVKQIESMQADKLQACRQLTSRQRSCLSSSRQVN